jgi:succinate dehydrogenase / fumarate reductase membrane anchor subunit
MSHKGSPNFIVQRASAVILAPLAIWFLVGLVSMSSADFDAMAAWLAGPANAFLMAALIAAAALHMRVGLADVILDYFDGVARSIFLLLNTIAAIAVTALAWWSLYRLVF